MIFKVFLFALFVAVVMAEQTAEEAWPQYKKDFNRSYDAAEDAERFAIFKEKYNQIQEQNRQYAAGKSTWTAGVNDFTDRKPEELKHLHGIRVPEGNAAGLH
ncbi:cathepsin L-like proteinase [Diabrotica virgifera virgifera]|uniref:Cathepsin L-like proteinase n=1 Tax=Diabrotica virgifera virgifera TaxID=50390 RepID=A0A6P7FMA9_DIAVI|nr:cathepsin L-like proteinase [Diabrotica virgifera virgifera]